jgi:hypothetical protein
MKNLKKNILRLLFTGLILIISVGISIAQQLGITSIDDNGCFMSGHEPNYIKDNNFTTYYKKSSNPCNIYLNLHLENAVSVAKVRVKASAKGLNISMGSATNYYRTTLPDETFYLVLPSGFSTITITADNYDDINIFEVVVTQINLASTSYPFTYDAAGNMINKKLFISVSQQGGGSSETDSVFSDKIGEMQMKIFPNPTKGELRLVIDNLKPEDNASAAIYSVTGAKVLELANLTGDDILNLSDQLSGTYYLTITVNSERKQWTVIKE